LEGRGCFVNRGGDRKGVQEGAGTSKSEAFFLAKQGVMGVLLFLPSGCKFSSVTSPVIWPVIIIFLSLLADVQSSWPSETNAQISSG
jgi:hypothetical protein